MKQNSKLKFVTAGAASVMLMFAFGMPSNHVEASAPGGAPGEKGEQAQQDHKGIKIFKHKPKVAPVPKKNAPNRIMTNFNGDTKHEMGFNWYTTDKFEDAKVWVSETGDFSDAKAFDVKPQKVNSKYMERDKKGNFIFADVEKMTRVSRLKIKMEKKK